MLCCDIRPTEELAASLFLLVTSTDRAHCRIVTAGGAGWMEEVLEGTPVLARAEAERGVLRGVYDSLFPELQSRSLKPGAFTQTLKPALDPDPDNEA